MKHLIVIGVFVTFCSACQWLITHPQEDAAIIESVETAVSELYEYETGQTLSPSQPPMMQGPRGP